MTSDVGAAKPDRTERLAQQCRRACGEFDVPDEPLIHVIESMAFRLTTAERTIQQTREILAHTDIGSLPNDWTLQRVAEARIDDLIKLRDQVRDTCTRAEQAERTIEELRATVEKYTSTRDHMYEALDATARQEINQLRKERDEARAELSTIKRQAEDSHEP